ncbi:unnamed protein product [Ostreobium quekettii]|uniref:peptidylprolyl isomerase n=1 Tax=Ostreobium quekettii TaxID=121088 RepID=A0A8S1J518_9CHLO|nr:unnamed protein product [Ostreobium quekettii]|eukprot:evm.model.scf_266.3 EVM.evm.TU.scf_266.3   scf_266:85086-91267(+)
MLAADSVAGRSQGARRWGRGGSFLIFEAGRKRPTHRGRVRQCRPRALLKPAPDVPVSWGQDTVEVWIKVPIEEGIRGRDVNFELHPTRMKLEAAGKTMLQGNFSEAGKINLDGSFWDIEEADGQRVIMITLEKKTMGYNSWKLLLESERIDMSVTSWVFLDIEMDGEAAGKIVIGLFGKEVPKTTENFRRLCTGEKKSDAGATLHYKGNEFFYILKGKTAEAGGIDKDGEPQNESTYGGFFEDESFRLEHNAAGLVGMCSSGPNTNGSHFYITLGALPEYNGKSVVFGRVERGMDVVRRIESCGSAIGEPKSQIVISDCGEVQESELEGLEREERKRRILAPLGEEGAEADEE